LAQPEHARARRAAAEIAGAHQVLLDLAVVKIATEVKRAAGNLLPQPPGHLPGLLPLHRRVETREHPIPARARLQPAPGRRRRVTARDQVAQHLAPFNTRAWMSSRARCWLNPRTRFIARRTTRR